MCISLINQQCAFRFLRTMGIGTTGIVMPELVDALSQHHREQLYRESEYKEQSSTPRKFKANDHLKTFVDKKRTELLFLIGNSLQLKGYLLMNLNILA